MHRDRRPDKQLESLLDKILIHQHDGKRRVMFFKFARRYKTFTSGCQTSFMPDICDKISTGDAIQVLVHRSMTTSLVISLPSTLELLQSPVDYVLCVFAIARILEWEDESAAGPVAKSGPYAFVYRCNRYGGGLLRVDENDNCHLLELNANVRRVGLIHACSLSRTTPECKVVDNGEHFQHNETLLEGGKFYYITREMGYPPRMA